MTKEYAIQLLDKLSMNASFDVKIIIPLYELSQALDIAIKALEQKTVLEKIRTEIEQHRRKTQSIDPYDLLGDCLDIIDKYSAESEDIKE